jgi:hypothetical protein
LCGRFEASCQVREGGVLWAVDGLFASGDEDEGEFWGGWVLGKAGGEGFELREEAFAYSSGTWYLLEVCNRGVIEQEFVPTTAM